MDAGSEGSHRQGLGESGHTLKQHMAVAEKPDEEALDKPLLADDHTPHFLGERLDPAACFLDATVEFLD